MIMDCSMITLVPVFLAHAVLMPISGLTQIKTSCTTICYTYIPIADCCICDKSRYISCKCHNAETGICRCNHHDVEVVLCTQLETKSNCERGNKRTKYYLNISAHV